jgi:hypothetical protein
MRTKYHPRLLLALALALSAASIEAQCPQWDVSGQWTLEQSNGATVSMNLRQNGTSLTGTAAHTNASVGKGGGIPGFESFGVNGARVEGAVSGNIAGNDFYAEISWDGGKLVGVYRGKVAPQGRLEGTTYDKAKTSSKATWFSTSAMKCKEIKPIKPSSVLKPAVTVPPPKVIKSTGKSPTKPAPAPPAAPQTQTSAASATITATPRVVTIPGSQRNGSTTLTWDGGPDHPYAEVWVKVDDQDETFVVENGKGSRKVVVEPGKTYLYILTDSGKRLATVTVRANK